MSNDRSYRFSSAQQTALVALRTLIGWHFAYEGYYKLALPGWTADGIPLRPWTSAGYLKAASGPLAGIFQRLVDAGWTPWIDNIVKVSLLLIGISLMLGLFTKAGCWGALFFLSLFYLLSVPASGVQEPGTEGAYLIVNKTLIEAAAVCAVLIFNTGTMAGLDYWLYQRRQRRLKPVTQSQSTAEAAQAAKSVPPAVAGGF